MTKSSPRKVRETPVEGEKECPRCGLNVSRFFVYKMEMEAFDAASAQTSTGQIIKGKCPQCGRTDYHAHDCTYATPLITPSGPIMRKEGLSVDTADLGQEPASVKGTPGEVDSETAYETYRQELESAIGTPSKGEAKAKESA